MVKKSKEKNDDYEFTIPDFDEKEFIQREKRKARTYFLSFAFGIIMGILSHFAWRGISPSYRWALTFLLAIASIGFLAKLLQIFKVDISQLNKKEWFGTIAFYFFTWLAIFIISINPPFYDASGPEIDGISIPLVQEAGGNILIVAKVTDNMGVDKVVINISDGTDWQNYIMDKNDLTYSYQYWANDTGLYTYIISADDDNGHNSIFVGNFTFDHNLVMVDFPDQPLDANDEIKIRVRAGISDNTYLVYYVIENMTINATRSGEDTIDGKLFHVYTTTPEFIGWRESSTVQLSVYVKTIHYFVGIDYPAEHTIDGGTYNVITDVDSNIGSTTSPEIKDLPEPRPLRQIGGFEFTLLLAALALVLLLIFRRRC
jgi:hypothetical protein